MGAALYCKNLVFTIILIRPLLQMNILFLCLAPISPTICNQSVFSNTPDCPYRSAKSPNRHEVRKDVGLEVGLAEKIIDLVLKDTEIKMSEMADQMSFNPITHIK